MIINQGLIALPTTPQAQTESLLFSQRSKNMPPLLIMAIDGVHVELEVPKGKTKNDDNPPDGQIPPEGENNH